MPQLSLHTAGRRALALAAGLATLAVAAFGIVREYQADRARAAWNAADLARAVRLEPDNAEGWHRLGRWEELSFAPGNLVRAREDYRRATELNPHEGEYWLDLAGVLAVTGAPEEAASAVEQALRADAHTPATLWRVGNFWLGTAEPQRAFPYLHAALEAEPNLAPAVIQAAHSAVRDPEMLLRKVLPPRPRFLLTYLHLLLRTEDEAGAARVWRALAGLKQPFEAKQSFFYFDHLIATGQVDAGVNMWNDLERLRLVPEGRRPGELLYNADLRSDILNGGFDWRVVEHPHVTVTLGDGRAGAAAPAILIRFSGEDNLHYRHFFQLVPVTPNTRYRFEAWVASENISTESGPRLEVYDPLNAEIPHSYSPTLVGTHDWERLSVEFTTGPRTRLVRAGLVRLLSQRVENRIRGGLRATEFTLHSVNP